MEITPDLFPRTRARGRASSRFTMRQYTNGFQPISIDDGFMSKIIFEFTFLSIRCRNLTNKNEPEKIRLSFLHGVSSMNS